MNDPNSKARLPARLMMQEAPYHSAAIFQIRDILSRHLRSLRRYEPIIASNLLVRLVTTGPEMRVVPDIFVAFGAAAYLGSSFEVPKDSNVRMFVLEVLSRGTYKKDQSTKMFTYAKMGVQEYWLFDPTGELQDPRLRGFRLLGSRYVPISGSGESKQYALHSGILCTDLYLEGKALRLASLGTAQDVPTLSELEAFWMERKTRQSE